jgi:hypothetical protein
VLHGIERHTQRFCAAMNIDELHQLVERKTETIKTLESLLEKEDAELVELEVKLESLENSQEQDAHKHATEAQEPT